MTATNTYPVDSTYHPCCAGVGRHASDCIERIHVCAPWCAPDAGHTQSAEVDGLLAGAHLQARQAAEDLEDVIDAMGDDALMAAVVDVATARAHLIASQRLMDRAAKLVTVAGEVEGVTR